MRDLFNNIVAKRGLSPVAATTDNTAYTSQIADTQNGDSLTFLWLAGSIADADVTFTLLVEHDDASGFGTAVAVPDDQLLGVETSGAPLLGSDNQVGKIGYRGDKRYVRVTITPANNSGNIFLAGVWVHGNVRTAPQSTQIV